MHLFCRPIGSGYFVLEWTKLCFLKFFSVKMHSLVSPVCCFWCNIPWFQGHHFFSWLICTSVLYSRISPHSFHQCLLWFTALEIDSSWKKTSFTKNIYQISWTNESFSRKFKKCTLSITLGKQRHFTHIRMETVSSLYFNASELGISNLSLEKSSLTNPHGNCFPTHIQYILK